MATINEIKQQAAAVKNATQVGENTAERVGGALAGLAELAEQQDSKLSGLSDLQSKTKEDVIFNTNALSDTNISYNYDSNTITLKGECLSVYVRNADSKTFYRLRLKAGSYTMSSNPNAVFVLNKTLTGLDDFQELVEKSYSSIDEATDVIFAMNNTMGKIAYIVSQDTTALHLSATLNTELAKKFDKESVVQESGEAEDKVMSQKAVSDKLSDLSSTIAEIKEKANTASTDASNALKKAEAANKTAEANKQALTTATADISTLKKKVDDIPATITKFVNMTEAAYEALETKEADTYYMLTEE